MPPAAAVVRDVILRDGTTLRLRAPVAEDAERVLAFVAGLSQQSRYFRFHGVVPLARRLVEPFVDPDWEERGALVGSLEQDGRETIVALGTWSRLRDRSRAEAAFAVADAYQGRGVGTRLLEQLAALAAEAGIEQFVADVLPANMAMLQVFERAGFEVSRTLAGGEVEVVFPIAPTESYRVSVETRDHQAVVASLRPFFMPASVAVAGASPRPGSIGGLVFRNIVEAGFTGAAYPVNRSGEPVAGKPGFVSLADLPAPVDLAVFCLPAAPVLESVEQALAAGTRALCVISAGFAETGAEGAEREARLLDLARGYGARLIGPNCLGISVAGPRLNATFAPHAFPPGRIGFSSQSGALGLALLERSEERGLGFSAFVSIGNKADVSSNDLLEYWEEDEDTELVVLYVESFGNPRRFGRLARRVSRAKPILALKSGVTRAGSRAASSHTAALAGSDAAVGALFEQAGVIRAETVEELVDVAALLSTQPVPAGRNVAVVTNAGGLGIVCADACEAAGLVLVSLGEETRRLLAEVTPAEASLANPVDLLGSATAETYARALPAVVADEAVDAVLVLFVPAAQVAAPDVAAAIDAVRAESPGKPIVPVLMAAEPPPGSFTYPESAARALGRAAERAEWLRRPAGSVPLLEDVDRRAAERTVEEALAQGEEAWLEADSIRRVLEAYRIPLVPERVVDDAEGAVAAAAELGFPAVVKTAAAGAHKTETGGVALDLGDEEAVREAAERIGGRLLVQPQVSGGVELLAGIVQDPVFGPLVAFGPGGVLAELIGAAGFRIAPLTDVDAEELVRSGKAGRLVAGFRGRPVADAAAFVDLLHRLSRLGEDLPGVAELDLNPVVGLSHGCVALDARVRVQRPERMQRRKTW
ncbi:MAG TPA: GNAT family N-acetyltransferase [Gaiellaceae bacterium]|nr:GNAT family N-acetyltransferase [Gaiellaceae bacterium]